MAQYRWFENYGNYTYETLSRLNSKVHGVGVISGGIPYIVSTNVLGITPYVAVFEDGTIVEDTNPPTFPFTPQVSPMNYTFIATHLSTEISGGNPAELIMTNGIITDGVVFGWFSNEGSFTNADSTQLWQNSYLNSYPNQFSLHDWYRTNESGLTINETDIGISVGGTVDLTKAFKGNVLAFLFDSSFGTIAPTINTLDGSSISFTAMWGLNTYKGKIPYIIRLPDDFQGYVTIEISALTVANTFYGVEYGTNIQSEWVTPS